MKLRLEHYDIDIAARETIGFKRTATMDFVFDLMFVYECAAEGEYPDNYLKEYYAKQAKDLRSFLEEHGYFKEAM